MRYLACLGIGLFIGVLCALMAIGLLRPRDPYPRAMMNVMKHALGEARTAAGSGCAGNGPRLQLLDELARDLEPVFVPGGEGDRVFARYAHALRSRIAAASALPENCTAQAEALTAIDNACQDCHRDYR